MGLVRCTFAELVRINILKLTHPKLLRSCHCRHGKSHRKFSTSSHLQDAKQSAMSHIRNIGIMAHIDAGKTTTTERMLYYSGFSRHLGDVDHGDTVMDYMEQERDRGITITSAAITFNWGGHKINLIDTPGHVDFTVEVERSLRVLDGAVAILDASAGVEAQTLTVWRQADKYHTPRLVYLNKMDKPGASLELCLQSLAEKLHVTPLVLNLPVGKGLSFSGVLDLITMKELTWDLTPKDDGRVFKQKSIKVNDGSAVSESVLQARADLIGQLADIDEDIADMLLSDVKLEDFPAESLVAAIRKAVLQQKVLPVLCGSSLKNKGVQPLLDAIVNFLPSPLDINYGFAKYYGDDLCALAFKVQFDKQRGQLTFVRIYSGMLASGANTFNINRGVTEKSGRILHVYADELYEVQEASAGNIVAITGLKKTYTGDTITSSLNTAKKAASSFQKESDFELKKDLELEVVESEENFEEEAEVEKDHLTSDMLPVLAGLNVPDPVFFCSVEAPSLLTQKSLDAALENLQKEDPSLRVQVNPETGQTELAGMGELHLDIIRSRLQKEYRLDADLGPLQIAYREEVLDTAEGSETIDKTIGGKTQYVYIKLSVQPDKDNRDFKHVNVVHDPENPLVLKPKVKKTIENGIKSALTRGPLFSFPVVHTSVYLHEFRSRYTTSLPMITAAAAMATQKALEQAGTCLLEPVMAMEITTEDDRASEVLTDLGRRRSHILNVFLRQNARVIHVMTPLQELMGYSSDLRTITSGRSSCSMELSHYENMSDEETQKVIQRISGFDPNTVY